LLAALALDQGTEPLLRLAAGEGAAAVNAIAPGELVTIYRSAPAGDPREAQHDTGSNSAAAAALRRAALMRSAEGERTPVKKARLIRAFLDEARHVQLYWPALQMMAGPASELAPVPDIGWFAETGIETSLAAGDYGRARAWAESGLSYGAQASGGLRHWLALADIADPALQSGRGANLVSVERLALTGRLDPVLLQRLATVLDALDVQVPMPLWEAASRTPQPEGGFLPETGVLTELQDASKKKEFGRTVLLAMKTLGPNGAEGAHMIALGDSIRALKRAGLETDARRLGLEALFSGWPRTVSN
jgi:hypothetical protein